MNNTERKVAWLLGILTLLFGLGCLVSTEAYSYIDGAKHPNRQLTSFFGWNALIFLALGIILLVITIFYIDEH